MQLIVDIDGTLFDTTQRHHLIPEDVTRCENWNAFNLACGADEPLIHTIIQVQTLWNTLDQSSVDDLVFLTSRAEIAREQTIEQLDVHFNMMDPWISLVMRPMDCHLTPVEFKRIALSKIIKEQCDFNPVILFDDHDGVIDMVREEYQHVIAVNVPSNYTHKVE